MGLLYFKKDGTIERYHKGHCYTDIEISGDTIEKTDVLETESLLSYMSHYVDFEEGFMFKTLMNKIFKFNKIYSAVFHDLLKGIDLKLFLAEWNSPVKKFDYKITEIEYLEIFRTGIEIHENDVIDDVCGLQAIGFYNKNKNITTPMSIGLMPLNQLKKYKLVLNNEYIICDANEGYKILYNYDKYFTVYEILCAIFNEITFYGNVEDKEIIASQLNDFTKSISGKIQNEENAVFNSEIIWDGDKIKFINGEQIEEINEEWYIELLKTLKINKSENDE